MVERRISDKRFLHTKGVEEEIVRLGEIYLPDKIPELRAAALLHDTGRYEQLRRDNTFKDSDSVDHAVFSHDIVVEKGWLDAVQSAGCSAQNAEGSKIRQAILDAVLFHNRRELPA